MADLTNLSINDLRAMPAREFYAFEREAAALLQQQGGGRRSR